MANGLRPRLRQNTAIFEMRPSVTVGLSVCLSVLVGTASLFLRHISRSMLGDLGRFLLLLPCYRLTCSVSCAA